MSGFYQIEKARNAAYSKYSSLKEMFQKDQSTNLAQELNQAWLELKQLDIEFNTASIQQTMGELYG